MILTVTLNAALDRSVTVPIFHVGHRHRASDVVTLAGGKGINVARALKALDVPVVASGLAGGRTGTRIVEELTDEAILNDFVRIRDESRTSTVVIDPTSGTHTEINEWGPKVSAAELEMLLEKLRYLSQGAEAVVFAGSLPRGVDEAFYADAARELTRRGVRVVLDTDGEPLRLAVEAEPWLVSPNQLEAEQLVGQELAEDDDFLMALETITEMGARNVHITHRGGVLRLDPGRRPPGAPLPRRRAAARAGVDGRSGRRAARAVPRVAPRRGLSGGGAARGRGRRCGVGARGRRRTVRPGRGPSRRLAGRGARAQRRSARTITAAEAVASLERRCRSGARTSSRGRV